MWALSSLVLLAADTRQPSRDDSEALAPAASSQAHLIPLPLPINGTVDATVKRMLAQVAGDAGIAPDPRPMVILEFQVASDDENEASEFERALSLARYLASDAMSGVRTVAFLPRDVQGHAVLVALACERIIIAADAEMGDAGRFERHIDETMRSAYRDIAERRRTIPAAVALAMLDPREALFKATTPDGIRYVTQEELTELEQTGNVSAVESLVAVGDLASFSGQDLRLKYGFASHLADDRETLLTALRLPSSALRQDPSLAGQWRPMRIDVRGPINGKSVNWLIRNTQDHLQRVDAPNFVCVTIDSPGGSLEDSLRLASFLAGLEPTRVRTVAYIDSQARADAAIVAWACDQVVMSERARLGGPGAISLSPTDVDDLRQSLRAIGEDKAKDWSLPVAMVDTESTVHRYANGASVRYWCDEEFHEQPDQESWKRGERLDLSAGLHGDEAFALGIADHNASNLDELRQFYQLDQDFQDVQPNWAHLAIERLASPRVAGTLLFIAWFALIIEMSQPGLSVAGFVSALSFLLFFWSNFLHGTAIWLEVLLFVAGVAALIIEIFVLPGFGVFGFGGACLVITSLVLASQTFVIPRNSYQYEQFASSLTLVTAGLGGALVSLLLVRKYLPDAPLFRRMMLTTDEDELEERRERELLADYRYLLGKRGRTTTLLAPSGKACFGDDIVDVISHGDALPPNTDVLVKEVRGSYVLVEPIEEG